MSDIHVLRVRRISRPKYPEIMAVVADHCGRMIVTADNRFRPRMAFVAAHESLIFPTGVVCDSLSTRMRLWRAVVEAENRSDANMASLWEGVIPPALTGSAAIALCRRSGQHLASYLSSVVDLVVLPETSDAKARMRALCTAREVGAEGLGRKNRFGLNVRQRIVRRLPTSPRSELIDLRDAWAGHCSALLDDRETPLRAVP